MKHARTYYIGIIVTLLILYLHPTLSAYLFPFKRKMLLNSYIAKIQEEKRIDPQEFWQWREAYYPGSITFTRVPKQGQPHTMFRSTYVTSSEYLVDVTKNKVGFTVRKTKEGTEIVFIKPISEMKTANGFFDYKDKDKKLLEGKYWLVVTVIRT